MVWGRQANDNSTPVVVQGVVVPSGNEYGKYGAATDPSAAYVQPVGDFHGYKGEQQPKQFNDVAFSVAFVAHLAIMLVLGVMYGPYAVQQGGGGGGAGGLVFGVSVCGLCASGLSSVSLGEYLNLSALQILVPPVFIYLVAFIENFSYFLCLLFFVFFVRSIHDEIPKRTN